MNRTHVHVWLVVVAFVLGAAGTAVLLPRGGTAPSFPDPQGATAAHGEDALHNDEGHGLIQLSPEAMKTAGIRVATARLTPIGESLTVPGIVETGPDRRAKITPPAPGRIVRILANLGERVRAGQPLVVLDSFEVAEAHAKVHDAESGVKQAQAGLQTARAEVAQAQAGVRLAEAELQQARTKQASAETALQRQRELAAAGAFSQPALQAAQAELSEAQSELLKAQTELQSHAVVLQRAERLFREELISRSELEQTQLEHRQDQTAVERARARVELAKQALEREQKVFQGDLLTRQAVQTAEAEVRAAQGDVQKAMQGVARARQDVLRAEKGEQAARIALRGAEAALKAARAKLYALEGAGHIEGDGGLLTLYAPLSGTVTERHATLGEAVERSTTLFVIENLRTVLVHADVPEKEVARARIGQPVEVAVAAYPRERFSGVVQSIAGWVDEKTRALAVRCLVENRDGRLKPKMFARVTLMVGARTQTLAVPLSALDEQDGQARLFVEEEGGFEARPVKVGRTTGTTAEIVDGLKPGDRVVVEGVFVLKSEAVKERLKGHAH